MPSLVPPVVPPGELSGRTQPELEARDDLLLRPWNLEDVTIVVEAYSDPAIQQWNLRSMDHDEAADWITGWRSRWKAETDAGWAVVDRSGGNVVGRVSLRAIDLEQGQGEVTYWTLSAARGREVAVAATVAVCRWSLNDLGLHRLELAHSVMNTASCRVATKAGFALEGIKRGALLHPDGWHDMHLHALIQAGI